MFVFALETLTVNFVPFTTAAMYGVCTVKCGCFLFSMSNSMLPAFCRTSVFELKNDFGTTAATLLGRKVITLFSLTRRTRPFGPVTIVSPSAIFMSCLISKRSLDCEIV